MRMLLISGAVTLSLFAFSPALAQEKKAKPEKVKGDVGLLDLEKNYMIVVTKEGKLATIHFDDKTKVTKFVPEKAKMSDIDLGQSASINYVIQEEKNVLESIEVEVKAKKGQ